MADAKTNLARDGTMQVTAKEGIDYLKSEGKNKLLEIQGLVEPETSKPGLPRDSTMAVTAKEGERLLGDATLDTDAQTRGQQRKIDEIKNETTPESPAKKPKMAKDSTMAATAKEGKDLLGKEKLGDTRQETAKRTAAKPAPKRGVTMAKTLEEAKFVLEGKEIDVNEGRRTRSQSRPQPAAPAKTPVKRAGAMQKTAKESKESVKRGKGKGKAAKSKADDAGDNAAEEKEEEEEKKEEEKKEEEDDEEEEEKGSE